MADDQRIDDLRRRVQQDPASIAFAQLAEELRRAGQYAESVQICESGLAIHPGYLSARVTLGRALVELTQLAAAQAELELVLKSAPENLAALRGLGEIHHRNGHLVEALAQYRAALALARNDPDLQETVAELARQVEPSMSAVPDETLSFDAEEAPSFDQIEKSLLALASPALTPTAGLAAYDSEEPAEGIESVALAPPLEEPVPSVAELEHAVRMVAALEQWLDAIHVVRADRRA